MITTITYIFTSLPSINTFHNHDSPLLITYSQEKITLPTSLGLEVLFSGRDIYKQLPADIQTFRKVDKRLAGKIHQVIR